MAIITLEKLNGKAIMFAPRKTVTVTTNAGDCDVTYHRSAYEVCGQFCGKLRHPSLGDIIKHIRSFQPPVMKEQRKC